MTTPAAASLPKAPHRDPDGILLPHHTEAERATLGAAIIETRAADYIVDKLLPECYFRRAHQDIFRAIVKVREHKGEVDFVALSTELERAKKLTDVGGPAYIAGLADGTPRGTNIAYYCDILKDLQAKRALVTFANETLDLVVVGDHRAEALLNDTDRRLMDLQVGHTEGRLRSLQADNHERFKRLEWRTEHKGELRGVDTGFTKINDLTLGWRRGDLIIVAARPSMGKTTFVTNSVVHAAKTLRRINGKPTTEPIRAAVFSLEMRQEQLDDRILSQLSSVDCTRIQSGNLGAVDYEKLSVALEEMNSLDIHIDDRADQSALDIRAACRRLKADGGLDLIVIDYVQLMPGSLERKSANRNDEITDISRRLKALADECRAPVILLSQLSRTRGARPQLEDLRDSGSLEQAADIVAFLHRKDHRASGLTEFILAKQRNGPTGVIYLNVERDTLTFSNGPDEAPEPTAEEKAEAKQAAIARNMRKKRSQRQDS